MALDFSFDNLNYFYMAIIDGGYNVMTFEDYLQGRQHAKVVILRHDIERKIAHALKMAELEKTIGIHASYYFRSRKDVFREAIIKKIVAMGHEIGYHYEDLSLAHGNVEKALTMFEKNLTRLRKLYPVKTISMHGSPLSQWDNRSLWDHYDYHNFGIIGEPYFDINFSNVLYLTDTGRRWDGAGMSIRDKVNSPFNYQFKTTFDIINALNRNDLPDTIMFNIHPHRWNDKFLPWFQEFIWQNTKNIAKKFLITVRK